MAGINILDWISGLSAATVLADTDHLPLRKAGDTAEKLSGTVVKSTLKTYFDTLYNNYTLEAHASNHTDSTDDIQSATSGQKGLATATQITKLDAIEAAADVTDAENIGSSTHGASAKTTPVDADKLGLIDSAASNVLKKLTWANLKATLKVYFDTLYSNTHYVQYRILDKDTAHTVDTGVGGELRIPEACTVLGVGAYCDTAGTTSVATIDINEAGSTILSTKITIDATEKSSKTAATPAVISDSAIAADAILTFDIDGIASGDAGKGLVVWLKVRF